jgi:hypothetical protein
MWKEAEKLVQRHCQQIACKPHVKWQNDKWKEPNKLRKRAVPIMVQKPF